MKYTLNLPTHRVALINGVAACQKRSGEAWIRNAIELCLVSACEAMGNGDLDAIRPTRKRKTSAAAQKGEAKK